jgi:hypothetical protein
MNNSIGVIAGTNCGNLIHDIEEILYFIKLLILLKRIKPPNFFAGVFFK